MNLSKKITAIIMLVIIAVCMCGYINLAGQSKADEPVPAMEDISDDAEEPEEKELTFIDKIEESIDQTEKRLNEIAFKTSFIDLNGLINKTLGKKMTYYPDSSLTVYKMNNGHLSNILPDLSGFFRDYSGNIISLDKFTAERGIDFVYVSVPFKASKFDPQLSAGVTDYTNIRIDELINEISEAGVGNIDLRQAMYDEGIDQYDMFFKTDHHWKPEAGLWAAGKINDYLVSEYGYEDNSGLLDIDNYNVDVYEDIFLGSHGKRTGKGYAGLDDLSLIYPKFPTDLTFSVPSKEVLKEGKFEDAVFDYSHLVYDYYNKSPYSVYTDGDHPYNLIVNNSVENGKKAILIRDSFSCVTAPYLSLCFSELHIFDMRYELEASIYDYIEEIGPDLVIVAYNGDRLWKGSSVMFKFDEIYEP